MLHAYCDGSITGGAWGKKTGPVTPPHAWYGWVIRSEDGTWIAHHSFDMGEGVTFSGNVAEHMAVSSALRWLLRHGLNDHSVIVHTDSQLIVGHLSGNYQVHKENLKKIADSTKSFMVRFPSVTMKWIPRKLNKYADFMSKCWQPKYGAPGIPDGEVAPEVIAKHR